MKKIFQNPLKIVLAIFVVSVSIIVLSHSFLEGYGLHLNFSISRYIGLELWSAIFFFICNLFNIFLLIKFFLQFRREHRMNFFWQLAYIIMLIGFFVLSACPVGLFDVAWGEFGTVSILHRTFAGIMFTSAIIVMLSTIFKFKNNKKLLLSGLLFSVFGIIFIVFFKLQIPWFMNVFLIPEALFLLWFVLIFLRLPFVQEGK